MSPTPNPKNNFLQELFLFILRTYSFNFLIFWFISAVEQTVTMLFPSFQKIRGDAGSVDNEHGDLATLSLATAFGEDI